MLGRKGPGKATLQDAFLAGKIESNKIVERVGDVTFTLHATSLNDANRKKLEKQIVLWMNEYQSQTNLFIRNFEKDLQDGTVLIKFVEQLAGDTIPHNTLVMNETSFKQNIRALMSFLETKCNITPGSRYSINDIYMGNVAAWYCLVVDLAHHYDCPHNLPSHVTINMVRQEMLKGGDVARKTTAFKATEDETDYHNRNRARMLLQLKELEIVEEKVTVEKWDREDSWTSDEGESYSDEFDELYDKDTNKMKDIEKCIHVFVNTHLGQVDKQVADLFNDFNNGVNVIFLLGVLGDVFVPIVNYNPDPLDNQAKMAAQLLKSVKLSDLLAARDGVQVITLEHNANIGEALDTLFREGIQSAPVLVGSTVEDGYDGGYLGMADVATILSAYVQGVLLNCDSGDKEKTIKEKSEEFMYRLLITVVGRDASLYYKGEGNHTLFEVITNCYLSDKTHRVALFNEHGAISAIITQFDVVKFLYENIDQLGEASALTLSQLGIGPKEVVTVGVDTTASETLILLATRGLSGVVVLNRDGRMIANVSASDFTGITNYERLSETLGLFLEIDKIEKLEEIYVVTIKPDSTLRETLELYVNESIHRLYMSDDLGRPTGVVTMTDLLAALVRYGA